MGCVSLLDHTQVRTKRAFIIQISTREVNMENRKLRPRLRADAQIHDAEEDNHGKH